LSLVFLLILEPPFKVVSKLVTQSLFLRPF
jgi:hypothetical protein